MGGEYKGNAKGRTLREGRAASPKHTHTVFLGRALNQTGDLENDSVEKRGKRVDR